MTDLVIVFPNQLFSQHPLLRGTRKKVSTRVVLIEDSLFFGDARYPMRFHKQKLAYHRATMAQYKTQLESKGWQVELHSYQGSEHHWDKRIRGWKKDGVKRLATVELNDFMLQKRLKTACELAGLPLETVAGPGFLNLQSENQDYRSGKKRWFMADYYQWQRRRLEVLVDGDKPRGGQWSFDEDNRKKLPKQLLNQLPSLPKVRKNPAIRSAMSSVQSEFAENPGELEHWYYPSTHGSAEKWLDNFLEERFELFGVYEDAIAADERWLYHAVLTPMLNTGLLTPRQVLDKALEAADAHNTPINSTEGFVRQIIGWREFMRATYVDLGVPMRTTNHWQHTRDLPEVFYTAQTGVDPVDNAIRRVLDTGYCHHIERLMVLGGFMFLCEINPDHIYRWFMELFIDSYDWVMVPNVYAMSQHADGGAITTKPYFSGSNYIIKMSHYRKAEWSEIWDALFWRWIYKNRQQLKGNPRWAMMVRNAEKMDRSKMKKHQSVAEAYLKSIA